MTVLQTMAIVGIVSSFISFGMAIGFALALGIAYRRGKIKLP